MPTWGGPQNMFGGGGGGGQAAPAATGGSAAYLRAAPLPPGAFSASLDSLAQRLGISAPPPVAPQPGGGGLRAPLPPVAETAELSAGSGRAASRTASVDSEASSILSTPGGIGAGGVSPVPRPPPAAGGYTAALSAIATQLQVTNPIW